MLRIRARCRQLRPFKPSTCVTQRCVQRWNFHSTTRLLGYNKPQTQMEKDADKFQELLDACEPLHPALAHSQRIKEHKSDDPKQQSALLHRQLAFVRYIGRREWIKWRREGGRNKDEQKPLLAQYFAQRLATGLSQRARRKATKGLHEARVAAREGASPCAADMQPASEDDGLWLPPVDQAMNGPDMHDFGSAWNAAASQPQQSDTTATLSSSGPWMTLQQRLRTQGPTVPSALEPAMPETPQARKKSKPSSKTKSSGKSEAEKETTSTAKTSAKRSKSTAGIDVIRISQHDLTLPEGHIEGAEGIPRLAHNLDRTLFDPGVHVMQDLRSDVYNFDPYLTTLPPNSEFDFEALGEFVSASKDSRLRELVQEKKHKYCGSTSSLSSILSHFHYLLSGWRKLNFDNISRSWDPPSERFTQLIRRPAASFAQFDAPSATYALDADKEFDTETILSMLGKSMEKLLVLPKDQFERYHLDRSHEITEEERNAREGYNYTGFGQFLVRSQLDAHDPRLPGQGIFDIKTRAALAVRMNMEEPEEGQPYEITKQHGQWDSFEREYVDMIRSAFLKYSLQVRMGGMDGIFCAYHNTKRIFGFQYIPLEEMDERVHGSSWQPGNPTQSVGLRELHHSFTMLEAFMEKATARFPNQTLRLHIETRDTVQPLMYFFAEPVTTAQMQSIQEATKESATASAERVIRKLEEMGDSTAVDSSKKTQPVVWEELKEEILAFAQDGTDMLDDIALDLMTKYGLVDNHSDDAIDASTQALAKTLLDAVKGDEQDTLSDDGDADPLQMITDEVEGDHEADNTSAAVSEHGDVEYHSADSTPEKSDAGVFGSQSELFNKLSASNDERISPEVDANLAEVHSDHTNGPTTNVASTDNHGIVSPPESITSGIASEDLDNESGQPIEESTAEASQAEQGAKLQTEDLLGDEAIEESKSAKNLSESLEEALRGNIDNQQALKAFVSMFEELRVNRDTIQPEQEAEDDTGDDVEATAPVQTTPQLMGLAITVKHTVNGKKVERPEFPVNSWDIDCTVKELKPEAARRIYAQVKKRRRAPHRKDDERRNVFLQKIQESADRGAAFRASREQDEASETGMKVAWADEKLPKNSALSIFTTK